MLKYSSREKHS